jgi:hypothetical protein
MTAEKKARKFVNDFYYVPYATGDDSISKKQAQIIALIAVDELIKTCKENKK